MTNRPGRAATCGALATIVAISVVGCAPGTYDGVLWRQVAAFKDPLGDRLASAVGTQSSSFAAALTSNGDTLPGTYWDGATDPALLGLANGGLAFSNVRENADSVIFDALISSGTRNPGGDRFADTEDYFGPSSIYTCFSVVVESASEAIIEWTYVNAECASDLVATLTDGAKLYPLAEFNG
ncbi:hypothetical protein [Cryobacterium sp. PH29-G1]|uniref:hypothetical protein n=1 Tax=Cryobacterium sp. PH29-G1 TaxID=3046211 RepID=UPI0024BAB34D|nr:hypothetical protein [Cryobacterium sp. PH29-G1]MDJ0350727.1 hypothetical protein [Cryobacterium sp. PH29-G1]